MDIGEGPGIGQIENIKMKSNGVEVHTQSFTYNNRHLPETITDHYVGKTFLFSNTYDALWRPLTSTSPSGLIVTNEYDNYGAFVKVKKGETVLWEGTAQNSNGQFTRYQLGNGIETVNTFSNRGELTGIETKKGSAYIQDNRYEYESTTGNLLIRNDLKYGRSESFLYDELDRLTDAYLNSTLQYAMNYHPNGNIKTKTDVGTYLYNTPKPHAMSGISGVQQGISSDKQFIEYTAFNKISRVAQGVDESQITDQYLIYYGLDEQRIKTRYYHNGSLQKTRYYLGSYEEEICADGTITKIDYIYTPNGLTAMQRNNTLYYVHTDRQGSLDRITDTSGTLVTAYAYTPWGGRILLSGVNITDRGYTGHEHLVALNLINMNGRVYDPVLARFLSPDPYVQAPDFTQSFNRFAYCLNNPFKYVDPSGEIVWFVPVIIGAVIGGVSGYMIGDVVGAKGWDMVSYIAGGALIGGLSGGAAAGASALGGGAMLAGAAAGAVSGAGFSGLATNWNAVAMLKGAGIGALSGFVGGGFASAIGGGWGAVAGGIASSGLNTALNGGSLGQIGASMLIGGLMAYGTYEFMSYLAYNDITWKDGTTYEQFKAMNTAYQRSRFWGKEFGVYLNDDGTAKITPWKDAKKLHVNFRSSLGNIENTMHSHWSAEGVEWVQLPNGDYMRYDATINYPEGSCLVETVGGYHSDGDLKLPGISMVVGRTTSTYYYNGSNSYRYFMYDPFVRFFLFPFLNTYRK